MNKLPKIGNTELYTARVLNMSVAQYYGIVKEYSEILNQAREINKEQLDKDKEKAELNLIYGIRYNLNKLVLEKLKGGK
jgi:ribosomal protein S13